MSTTISDRSGEFRSEMILRAACSAEDEQIPPLGAVGQKAAGLYQLPDSWRPPFFILTTEAYSIWQASSSASRSRLIAGASQAIAAAAAAWINSWPRGIILRSSATKETLLDRGALASKALTADFDSSQIARIVDTSFSQFENGAHPGALALVVQPLVPGGVLGHLSNERRVSKTVNHWMWECDVWGTPTGRFNSQRTGPPAADRSLIAQNDKQLIALFKAIGRWCTRLNRGPAHLEWSWDKKQLWLLQLDFENESPDDGVDPKRLLREAGLTTSHALPRNSPITEPELSGEPTGWSKLDKLRQFIKVRTAPFPTLYLIEGHVLKDALKRGYPLKKDISAVTGNRAVCRTDCRSEKVRELNLPRTDSVSAKRAVSFLEDTLQRLLDRGVLADEVAFILHRFIPAQSAAWAWAHPANQIVLVDSLWGVPDGLQFLPHDSFEYDVKRDAISAERLRYKPVFIQETADGTWREVKIARRLARNRSIGTRDLREVARQTHMIATNAGEPKQIMWFCGIPEARGIGRNLPWFMMPGAQQHERLGNRISPGRARISIRSIDDIDAAVRSDLSRKPVLVLQPEVDLIREDERFLGSVITLAKERGLSVELHGSVLCHAFYLLQNAGVTVIPGDEPTRTRVRGKQLFEKIVRDEIPSRIKAAGETARVAEIPRSEARPALMAKLLEELQELRSAESPDAVTAELADLFELVRSLSSATGVEWEHVTRAADEKRSSRGGFERGFVLLETAWPSSPGSRDDALRQITLKSLARRTQTAHGVELTFPTLFLGDTDRTAQLPSGAAIRVSLTRSGILVEEVTTEDPVDGSQLVLPIFTK